MIKEDIERCLLCKKPTCKTGCPIDTDIPLIIKLCREENYVDAYQTLMENNPLASVTSRVCPHEFNCFGNCILNKKNEPISFYKLEQKLTERFRYEYTYEKNNIRVAVVGSGPAGLFSAIYLARRGFNITIYEKNSYLGGILTDGIPSYRLEYKYIVELIETLKKLKVEIHLNKEVNESELLEINNRYDFTILATGLSKSRELEFTPNIKIIDAVDYLRDYNLFKKLGYSRHYDLKGTALVIGLGNVACDAANVLTKEGVDTQIIYRRSKEEAPSTPKELEECINNGVSIRYLLKPDSYVYDNNKLIVKFEKTVLGKPDQRGRRTPVGTNEFEEITCNYLITALGQIPSKDNYTFIGTDHGYILADENGHTNVEKLYAVGDCVTGPKTVVEAISYAKKACLDIIEIVNNSQK